MTALAADLRGGARLLARHSGWTVLAASTLALGLGACIAIFSIVKGVLLTPLPYPEPQQLLAVYSQFRGLGFDRFWLSASEYLELGPRMPALASLGAFVDRDVNLAGAERPMRVHARLATASLLHTLRIRPLVGRLFTPAEDAPGAERVALLSAELWHQAFASEPGVVGRRIEVDGVPHTVVGVLPPGLGERGVPPRVWLPLAIGAPAPAERARHRLNVIARLRPGTGIERARRDLAGVLARWPQEMPDLHTPNAHQHPLVLERLLDDTVGSSRPALRLLMGAVALLLAIACVNVANLLWVRNEARRHEIRIRIALGVGRLRLTRQFLVESLMLALLGGVLGLLLAALGLAAIVRAAPDFVPRAQQIRFDPGVVLFGLALAILSSVLSGLAPTLRAWTASAWAGRASGDARSIGGHQRVRHALVLIEVTLAAMLVLGAALLTRSLWELRHVDLGFEPEGVLSAEVALPAASYPRAEGVAGFYRRLVLALGAQPGVRSAAAVSGLPPEAATTAGEIEIEGRAAAPGEPPHNVQHWQYTTHDLFQVLRIPLLAGRTFGSGDAAGAPPVAVIEGTLAKAFWGGAAAALGKRVRPAGGAAWLTIVGVVKPARQGGVDRAAQSAIYLLTDQVASAGGEPPRDMFVLVRGPGDPRWLAGAVQTAIRRLDPSLPAAQVRDLTLVVSQSISPRRLLMRLVLIFAAVALGLATVGTYGVLAYGVAGRTREIGVRMALGAQARNLAATVLGEGLCWTGAGLALGMLGGAALSRLLSSLLYGVSANDPLAYVSVALLLLAVSLIACGIPARRAARVDPMTALRHE